MRIQLSIAIISVVIVFSFANSCQGSILKETDNIILSIDSYLRQDLVSFKNVVDLDSANKDDSTVYFGIDYSVALALGLKNNDLDLFLKLERNGPFDYSAPLFIHNTLTNTGGNIKRYRDEELLPQVEEFWVDAPIVKPRFKVGLYTYQVGNGFALNGGYENYGAAFYQDLDNFSWRLYYSRPELVYKYRLGPRISQEREQGIYYDHSRADFVAGDAKIKVGDALYQPYVGALVDYTTADKRDNSFSTPIKHDILGTVGVAWSQKQGRLIYDAEFAHNFGKGASGDPQYKDIYHTGYLAYSGVAYNLEKLKPSLKFLLCSGNKVTPDMAQESVTTLTSGKNRAFSYYSPLNGNLLDSVSSSNVDMLPIVAFGGGYGLHYGVPRPGTFASGDFDNLIMPRLSLEFSATKKLTISIDGYYLRSFEKGAGTLDGQGKYLSTDLGKEVDLFFDYQLSQGKLFSILGGYFFPGRYYKEPRDDVAGSIFSPFTRGDANAAGAYEIEASLEMKF